MAETLIIPKLSMDELQKLSINPLSRLSHDDFCLLFEQAPLDENDREKIKVLYWNLYLKMIDNPSITPKDAWLAVQGTFISQETHIGERIAEAQKV